MNEFNIDFSIDCFYSKTRNHSTYITIKDLDEDWNKAKFKVGAVKPSGYIKVAQLCGIRVRCWTSGKPRINSYAPAIDFRQNIIYRKCLGKIIIRY